MSGIVQPGSSSVGVTKATINSQSSQVGGRSWSSWFSDALSRIADLICSIFSSISSFFCASSSGSSGESLHDRGGQSLSSVESLGDIDAGDTTADDLSSSSGFSEVEISSVLSPEEQDEYLEKLSEMSFVRYSEAFSSGIEKLPTWNFVDFFKKMNSYFEPLQRLDRDRYEIAVKHLNSHETVEGEYLPAICLKRVCIETLRRTELSSNSEIQGEVLQLVDHLTQETKQYITWSDVERGRKLRWCLVILDQIQHFKEKGVVKKYKEAIDRADKRVTREYFRNEAIKNHSRLLRTWRQNQQELGQSNPFLRSLNLESLVCCLDDLVKSLEPFRKEDGCPEDLGSAKQQVSQAFKEVMQVILDSELSEMVKVLKELEVSLKNNELTEELRFLQSKLERATQS